MLAQVAPLRVAPQRRGAGSTRRGAVRVHADVSRRDTLLGAAALLVRLHTPRRSECSAADVQLLEPDTSWQPALVLPRTAFAAGETSLYDFTVQNKGQPFPLSAFKDKNRNYPSLRQLYNTYHADGLELLAFPANQFGGQAPGTSEEERAWAIKKFGFEFPVMDKIAVLNKPTPQWEGPTEISPVYAFLKAALPGEIPWNYTKFLVGRDGVPLRRYGPGDPLDQGMEEDIKNALAGKPLRKRKSDR